MRPTDAPHPSFEQLSDFLLGIPSLNDRAGIEAHVASCDQCCAKLADVSGDAMTKLARDAATAFGEGTLRTSLRGADRDDRRKPLPPQLVNHPRYRITSVLGSGGMGTVYKAEHRVMQRVVALKVIKQELVSHPHAAKRFQLEVETAAKLSHPHIVTAYDAERVGDLHFLVMEFVEGATLATQVAEGGPLPIGYACDFIQQAALGLQYAHDQGMVHRDIKPQNLKIRRDTKEVKILDFGLARFASEADSLTSDSAETLSDGLTRTDSIIGTPDYMAPEQFSNASSADIRADIYSLGCTLYFLLAGRPPFAGTSLIGKLSAHRTQLPAPIEQFRSGVPAELTAIVRRMTAKDPAARFQTPQEVADALGQFVSEHHLLAELTPPPLPRPVSTRRPNTRRLLLCITLASAAMLLVAGVALLATPKSPRVLYVLPPAEMSMSDYDSRAILDVAGVEVVTASHFKQIKAARRVSQQSEPQLTADLLLADVDATQFDAIVFVGVGMWQFWCFRGGVWENAHQETTRIIEGAAATNTPVVCLQNGRVRLVGPLHQRAPLASQLRAFSQQQQRIWSSHEVAFEPPAEDDGLIMAATHDTGTHFLRALLKKLGVK